MASELYVETLKGLTSGANANKVIIPSGQTLIAPGHVLQVVQDFASADESSTSTDFVDSSLSVNITPTSTTSKMLVLVCGTTRKIPGHNGNGIFVRVNRNSTTIAGQSYLAWNAVDGYNQEQINITVLDSPGTTDELTYKLQYRSNLGYTSILSHDASAHSITVMEIAG